MLPVVGISVVSLNIRVFIQPQKTPVFHKIDGLGTNNLGEFLAIVHVLAWQQKEGVSIPICSDSDVAIGWVKREKSAKQHYLNPKIQSQSTA